MVKIDFKLTKDLKEKYIELLCNRKFGRGKNSKTILEKFEEYKKLFDGYTLKDIIFIRPENMRGLIENIEAKNPNIDELRKLFKYDGKFQPIIAKFFEEYLNPITCYYCNIDYINVYGKRSKKNKFTLDHFIDKGRYPYLALSIFNLIPSCYICNSKLKGSTPFYGDNELENGNPHLKNFDFDEKVKFKLFLSKDCRDFNIQSKYDIEIELKERYSNNYKKYIEIFKLNERHQAHKNIVFEMIEKAQLYPESRLKELEKLTGVPYQQIKRDIFKLIDDEVNLSKEPFSKLKRDIAYELELI